MSVDVTLLSPLFKNLGLKVTGKSKNHAHVKKVGANPIICFTFTDELEKNYL